MAELLGGPLDGAELMGQFHCEQQVEIGMSMKKYTMGQDEQGGSVRAPYWDFDGGSTAECFAIYSSGSDGNLRHVRTIRRTR